MNPVLSNDNQVPCNKFAVFSSIFQSLSFKCCFSYQFYIFFFYQWEVFSTYLHGFIWNQLYCFRAFAFGSSNLNRGWLIQKAKVANYGTRPTVFCIRTGQCQTGLKGHSRFKHPNFKLSSRRHPFFAKMYRK